MQEQRSQYWDSSFLVKDANIIVRYIMSVANGFFLERNPSTDSARIHLPANRQPEMLNQAVGLALLSHVQRHHFDSTHVKHFLICGKFFSKGKL